LPARSTKQFGIQDAKVFSRWCPRVSVLTFRTRYHQGVFFAAVEATVFHDVFPSFQAGVRDDFPPAMPSSPTKFAIYLPCIPGVDILLDQLCVMFTHLPFKFIDLTIS
jgi:hypothetical protein